MTLVKFKNGNGMRHFPSFERSIGFPSFFSDTLERLWTDENVSWMPSVNIKEREKDFKIDLAVPGMEKKDFNVEVENGVLIVSGERKEENNESTEKVTRREFHYGTFKRSFSLPENANTEGISASYKDGVLSLTVAKHNSDEQRSKKQIVIG